MQAYMVSEREVRCVLNLVIKWRWAVSLTL